jgi:hypothetical protein
VSTIELGTGIPAIALRLLIACCGAGIVAVLGNGGIGGPALVLIALAVLMSAGVPASPAPALVVLLVALSMMAIGGNPFSPRVLAMVPLVHLLHVSCGLAALIPVRARIQPAALRKPAVRFAAIQAGVFALAGLMAVAPTGRVPGLVEMVAVGGIAAIAVILWWLVHGSL